MALARYQRRRFVGPNPRFENDLRFLWSGAHPRQELISGAISTVGAATQTVSDHGLVAACSAGQQNIEWPRPFLTTSHVSGTGDFTLLVVANPANGGGTVEHLFAQKNDAGGSPYSQAALLSNASTDATYQAGGVCFFTYSSVHASAAAASVANGTWRVLIGIRRGTTHELWVDGVLSATSVTTALKITQASRYTAIGSRGNGTTEASKSKKLCAAGWDRALSREEAAEFSSPARCNALLFPPRRILVPVSAGGGGTTPVSSDRSLAWTLRSGVQADQGLTYPVKNAAQQDQPLAYPVKNAAQQSQSLAWTLRAGVQASRALSWALLNAAQSNRALSYTLRSGVQQSHALTYPVSASILRQLDLSWSVLNSGTVVSTLPLTWLVRAGVLSSRSLAWALRSGVQRTHDLAWAILNSGTVTSQRSLSWLVRSAVQQPQTLAYPVRNAVQADRTIAYPVLTAAQSNLLIDYLVRAGVQVSFPLAYGVAGTVQNQLPLVWVVFSSGGVPELLCVNVESAFPFSALVDSGFPDMRAAVTKAMTVCGDC